MSVTIKDVAARAGVAPSTVSRVISDSTHISDKTKQKVRKIMDEMGRGVTILNGYGFYTKAEREVIYCIVAKSEMVRLKNLITDIDPEAFISISVVHDVHGEGFTLDENKKPIEL